MVHIRPDYHENGVYHVYNRGVAKLPIFLKDTDYFDFREIMRYYLLGFPKREGSDTSEKIPKTRLAIDLPVSWKADPAGNGMFHDVLDLLAYCLMPNHFHFLIRIRELGWGNSPQREREVSDTSRSSLSEFIKRVSITYAHKFNHDNNRVGPIFQGRFKVKEVDSDELVMHIARYIHLNSTMAGLVQKPEQWPWSDLADYYRFNPLTPSTLSKPRFVMEFFDHKPDRYRDFVEAQLTKQDIKTVSPIAIDPDE